MNHILPPCGDCERKGCGAYHDQCEQYKAFLEEVARHRKMEREETMKRVLPANPYLKKKLKERSKGRYR